MTPATQTETKTRKSSAAKRPGTEHTIDQAGTPGMAVKDQTPAVMPSLGMQDQKWLPENLPKADSQFAIKIGEEWRGEHDRKNTLAEQLEKAKLGLSDTMFKIAKRAAESADKAGDTRHTLGYFRKLCEVVEIAEITQYERSNKLETGTANAQKVLGGSWRTVKSKVGRGIEKGYDPRNFSGCTVFINEAVPPTARGTKARATATGAQTEANELAKAGFVPALIEAMGNLSAALHKVDKSQQIAVAERIDELADEIADMAATDEERTERKASRASRRSAARTAHAA